MIRSIEHVGEQGKVMSLEELCLRDNKITAESLRMLGRVIKLAAGDLRDLDLSNNLIAIDTNEEASAWEAFLNSFAECCVLRRIDFSCNALGPKAFEILARVYAGEEPVDLLPIEDVDVELDEDLSTENSRIDHSRLEHQTRKMSITSNSVGSDCPNEMDPFQAGIANAHDNPCHG